jgi:hypothetical protein
MSQFLLRMSYFLLRLGYLNNKAKTIPLELYELTGKNKIGKWLICFDKKYFFLVIPVGFNGFLKPGRIHF